MKISDSQSLIVCAGRSLGRNLVVLKILKWTYEMSILI